MAAHDTTVVTSPSSIPHHLSTRSPRSSLESSPRTPTSPFLQNLSNRFRKSSNASNFSNASEPPSQSSNPPDNVEDAQSAKRFVLSIVRNDWEWPAPQPSAASGRKDLTEAEEKQQSMLAQREAISWRTRHEATSDLDLDLSPVTASGRRRNKRNSDPYRFENPDAIANAIQQKRLKRRRANAEEARWNEGLRAWTEQRDAWTAAQPHRPKKRSSSDNENRRTFSPTRAHHKASTLGDQGETKDPDAAIVNGSHSENGRQIVQGHDIADTNDTTEDDNLDGPYLPIFPPLFPSSHTLRARIKPAAYPTIYSKVVLQSLTPNVPIPLGYMVSALVDGWKAEGNWPPQTLVEQQQHALLKRAKGAKKGESAFQKWRRERDAERNNNNNDIIEDDFGIDSAEEDDHEKKGFRKSISGAVRKVFGLNHDEVEEDGGLAKLGLSFGNSDGLMDESRQVAEDNVTLNKALLEVEKE